MEAGEVVSIVSRKEVRRQKLMEYLAAKGKMKLPNLESHNDGQGKKLQTSALKVVMDKENKAPADRPRYEGTKVKALPLQSTQNHTSRALGVNKGNIKGSTLTGQKDSNPLTAVGSHAQSKPNLNKVFSRTYTLVSSKPTLDSSNYLRKKTNTTKESFAVATSNTTGIDLSKSQSRSNSTSCAPRGGLTKTVSGRIIHGPMVKTKTGLVPAVTQLKNRGSDPTSNSATKAGINTTISFANKVRSSTSSVPVSQRSTTVQRKTLPASLLSNPAHRRTTVLLTARAEVKTQNKSNVKPNLGKHSQSTFRNEFSYGGRTTSTSSKYPAASAKLNVSNKVPKLNKRVVQPTDRPTNQRSEAGAQKIDKQRKGAAHTSSAHSVTIHTSRVINKVPLADPRGKSKTIKETENKKAGITAKPFNAQTGMKRMTATGIPHTVPRPTSSISCTSKPEDKKTPKVPIKLIPQTEGKKMTAAQEERMRKLQEWREAKGKTYKRPPMPVKAQNRHTVALPQPFWSTMKEEDEAHSLICAVDRSLADCIKLLGEGCPTDQVKDVLSRLPVVSQKFAKYWICQARLMEKEGNLDVLPMFEKAVGVVLEPVDELRSVVFEILKRKDELQASEENEKEQQTPEVETTPEGSNNPMMTPKPVRALICGERGNSSVVKYKITATPGGAPCQQTEPTRVNGQEVRFFTPVRRSVRIERASLQYPASLQDHDVCVASYNDLIAEDDRETSAEASLSVTDTPMYIYRENEALKDKVCVQLLCDEV